MAPTASKRTAAHRLVTLALALAAAPATLAAQEAASQARRPAGILSSQIETSRDAAELTLELQGGRQLEIAVRDGRGLVNGRDIGFVPRGGALDRSWRELLNRAMVTPSTELPQLLAAWDPPAGEGPGGRFDAAIEAAVGTRTVAAGELSQVPSSDTLTRLQQRIEELERRLGGDEEEPDIEADADEFFGIDRAQIQREIRQELEKEFRERRQSWWQNPFRHIARGVAGILSLLMIYAVLVGLGFAAVFFGGRQLEAVADTARQATLRSWLVGLAGSFLVLPVFILGTVALAISIVGIPALLVWVPLFPVAFILACAFGYLGVAHATGEALAERRFHGGDWFKRANSYYYMLTGLALLLALFLGSHVVEMAGPWLGFVHGTLMFLGVVLTWAAFTIGFGAVLLSRGGTRPLTEGTAAGAGDAFAGDTNV